MLQKLSKNRGGFTLVEIMIVVAIIALLAAIAVPNFLRARKRSQATRILEDLRLIDSAIDQYAIENNKHTQDMVTWSDVQKYLKQGSTLYSSNATDLLGNMYDDGEWYIDTDWGAPHVPWETYWDLEDVAPEEFWGKYAPYGLGPLMVQ